MTALLLALRRPIPDRSGWARERHCRILAGCYETEYGREVSVPEQIGEIVGWSYFESEGREPVAITMYVRVQL